MNLTHVLGWQFVCLNGITVIYINASQFRSKFVFMLMTYFDQIQDIE